MGVFQSIQAFQFSSYIWLILRSSEKQKVNLSLKLFGTWNGRVRVLVSYLHNDSSFWNYFLT